MGFLAVIIAYIASISLSGHGEPVTGWAIRWHDIVVKREFGAKLTIAVYLLVPVAIIALLLFWIGNLALTFVASIAVLLLAFKSGDQPESLVEFRQHLEKGDDKAAWKLAVDELGLEGQMYESGDDGIEEGVQAGLGYLNLERFFVTIFWFMAFGVPGVILVWLMSVAIHVESTNAFSQRVKQALYWIPVRLMAFTLALMGDFSKCFPIWLDQAKDFERDDRVLLITCLKSSLTSSTEDTLLDDTLSLLKRTRLAWLVALGLVLIFGF